MTTILKYKYVHYMTLYNEAASVRSLRSGSRIVYWGLSSRSGDIARATFEKCYIILYFYKIIL